MSKLPEYKITLTVWIYAQDEDEATSRLLDRIPSEFSPEVDDVVEWDSAR